MACLLNPRQHQDHHCHPAPKFNHTSTVANLIQTVIFISAPFRLKVMPGLEPGELDCSTFNLVTFSVVAKQRWISLFPFF